MDDDHGFTRSDVFVPRNLAALAALLGTINADLPRGTLTLHPQAGGLHLLTCDGLLSEAVDGWRHPATGQDFWQTLVAHLAVGSAPLVIYEAIVEAPRGAGPGEVSAAVLLLHRDGTLAVRDLVDLAREMRA